MMRLRVLSLFFVVLALVVSITSYAYSADTPTTASQLLVKAEKALADGNFDKAANIYAQLWRLGVHNAAIAYNAGTAYLKAGKVGWAILFLERAVALAPSDKDVLHNLQFARSQMKPLPGTHSDASAAQTKSGKGITLNSIAQQFSANFWGMMFLLFLWITALFAIAVMFVKGKLRIQLLLAIAFSVVITLGLWGMLQLKLSQIEAPYAVVVSDTEVKEGPHKSFAKLFSIPEGAKVLVLDDVEGWLKIKLPNGLQGYVESKTTRLIDVFSHH